MTDASQILFSVVIPCYNREKEIVRTLQSVLDQSYKNFEVIVVDDGSKDNSVEVAKSFSLDERIHIVPLEKNSGVHVARNEGISRSKGEYIIFLDSDDEMTQDALQSFYEVAITDKKISIISAPYIDDDGNTTGLYKEDSGYVSYEDLLCMRISKKNRAGLTCVSHSLLGDIRFVAPNVDFIFYRYLMRKGSTFYIARPLGLYHRSAKAGNLNFERKKPNTRLSIIRGREIDRFLHDFKDDLVKYCPPLFADYAYGAFLGLLLDGRIKDARRRGQEIVRYGGTSARNISLLVLPYLPFSPGILRFLFWLKGKYYL